MINATALEVISGGLIRGVELRMAGGGDWCSYLGLNCKGHGEEW